MKLIGLVLVILGFIAVVAGVIGSNRQTTLFDADGFKATTVEHKTPPLTPVAGALALAGGVLLLMSPVSRRTRTSLARNLTMAPIPPAGQLEPPGHPVQRECKNDHRASAGDSPTQALGTGRHIHERQPLLGGQTVELELLRGEVDVLRRTPHSAGRTGR